MRQRKTLAIEVKRQHIKSPAANSITKQKIAEKLTGAKFFFCYTRINNKKCFEQKDEKL